MDLARIWAGLARRFGRGFPAAAKAGAVRPPPAPPERISGEVDPDAFARALVGMVRCNIDKRARLHLVSLADFRLAAGAKWARVQPMVEMAAGAIVRSHINPNHDILTRLDAETSCLAMPKSSHREACTRVAAIAQDLADQLFGGVEIDGRPGAVVAAEMEIRQALDADDRLDRSAIAAAMARAAADPTALHHAALRQLLTPAPAADGPAGKSADPPAAAPAAPTPGEAEIPDWLEAQLADKTAAALSRPRRMAPETSLRLTWTPIWVTNRQAIGAFQAKVIRLDGDGAPPLEGAEAYAGAAPVEALTLDRFVATRGAAELKMMFVGRQPTGLTIPFHWMSLAPRWRDCIRIPFDECSPAARRRRLKVEIFGLSPEIPPAILSRLFEPLEYLGCDVMARLALDDIAMIRDLHGIRAVGVDLTEIADAGDGEIFARLSRFRDAGRQAHLACYVWGVRRRALFALALQAGFSLIGGPAVMGDLDRPLLPAAGRRAA